MYLPLVDTVSLWFKTSLDFGTININVALV